MQWVNQDSQAIKDIHERRGRRPDSSSELGVFVQSDDVFSDKTVQVRRRVHRASSCAVRRRRGQLAARGSSIETAIGDIVDRPCPGATDVAADRRRGRSRRSTSRRAGIQASTVSQDGDGMNIVFRDRARRRSPSARASSGDPRRHAAARRASAPRRRVSRSSASGCSTTSRRTGSC